MKLDFEKILDGSKFYPIEELENLLAWPKGYILKSAIKKGPRLFICINVPDECMVFSVDISSINQGFVERFRLKSYNLNYPSPSVFEAPQYESRGRVAALIVDQSVLVDVENNWFGVSQKFFGEAYIVEERRGVLSYKILKLVTPKRHYNLDAPKDVLLNADVDRARYAVYREDSDIIFTDGAGYTDALDVPVKRETLYVRGYDFIEWFKKVGYFYTGNIWRRPNKTVTASDDFPVEEHVLGDSSLSELSGEVVNQSRPKKIRMNDFRIQVVRGVSSIMKERKISAAEVYADDLLRLFNDEANKGSSDFFFENVSVSGNKKELFFRDATGGKHQVSKKKTTSCLKRVVEQLQEGVLRPDGD